MSPRTTSRLSKFWTIHFHVLFYLALTVSTSVARDTTSVNCYMEDDILQQQKTCFDREGIDISLPSTSVKASKEKTKTDLLNSLIENEPDMVCRQKEGFKRALPCVMEHARKCMPTDYRDFLPHPDSMSKTVDKLCSNQTEVNFTCVKSMGERLFDCTLRKGQSAFKDYKEEITAKNVLCKAFELSIVCQKEVFPDCGCHTTRVYTDIFLDYVYPSACPAIGHKHGHVVCSQDGQFVSYNELPKQGANRHHNPNNGIDSIHYNHYSISWKNSIKVVGVYCVSFLWSFLVFQFPLINNYIL